MLSIDISLDHRAMEDPATGTSGVDRDGSVGRDGSGERDGSIATIVVPQQTAVAIEYPGYIRNVGAALTTLGGEAGISTAVATEAPYLTLRLRPEDPYSHPLFSDKPTAATSLLLRISRPRNQPEGSSSSSGEATVTAVARVTRVYRFSGLADFQFLPPQRAAGRDGTALSAAALTAYNSLPEDNKAMNAEPFKRQEPFLMVPPLFSRLDMPSTFTFKDSSDRPELAEPTGGKAARVVSFYDFSLPGPVAPPADADAQLAARIGELLQERPVWSVQLLLEKLAGGISEQVVLPLLRACCYQFRTGQWKSMYIRCGYDPRSNPDSRPWQRVAYNMTAERHKEYMARQPPPTKPTMAQLNSFSALPTSRTTHLQLADLQDAEVQRLLLESPTPERASEAYGWFSPGNHAQVTAAVNAAFKRLIKALPPSTQAAGPSTSGDVHAEGSPAPDAMQLDGPSPSGGDGAPTAIAAAGRSSRGRGGTRGRPPASGRGRGRGRKAAATAAEAQPATALPASGRGEGGDQGAGTSTSAQAASAAAEAAAGHAPAPQPGVAPPAFLAGLVEQLSVGSEQQWMQQRADGEGGQSDEGDESAGSEQQEDDVMHD